MILYFPLTCPDETACSWGATVRGLSSVNRDADPVHCDRSRGPTITTGGNA